MPVFSEPLVIEVDMEIRTSPSETMLLLLPVPGSVVPPGGVVPPTTGPRSGVGSLPPLGGGARSTPTTGGPGGGDVAVVVPVPFRSIANGEATALLVTETVAAFAPAEVGWKVTLKVQVAFGATAAAQPGVTANEAVSAPTSIEMSVTLRSALPMLLTVMTRGADVVPTCWSANVTVAGDTRMTGAGAGGTGVAIAIASSTEWVSNALHFLLTGSVPVQKRSCSMFQRVSVPSPLAKRPPAATEALSATVTLPSAFLTMV